ncbi:MAG: cation:proton antiporter, partial [Thermoplasmatales archaeon]|nr:cation:proton antiporter [Thermoplasmatales archaeon]
MLDITLALIILGAIMILGFIGNFIFNKTQIPSIVWLLVFGLIVGFIFNVRNIDPSLLMTISKFFAAIAIVIILFDGGINTDLYQLFKGAPRGLLLSISAFTLSVLATMAIVVVLSATVIPSIPLENSVVIGVILGAIVGGTSSPIVIPLASRLQNLQERTKMALSIESIITDPLCIVVVLAAFYMITFAGGIDLSLGVRNLVSTFSVGAVMGFVLGLSWLPIMNKVRKEQFSYVITLAVVFLVYSL